MASQTNAPRTDARPAPGPAVAEATGHDDDLAAIRAVIADVQTAVNTNDVDLAVAHFAPDALVVNAAGAAVSGRDALVDAHRQAFRGFLRDQHARYEVADVRFVAPDVAIALKEARATDADGELLDLDHAMRALYTFVRRDGRWWIVARGNTLVAR